MPKLGADFNAGDPTDAAFVRHPTRSNLSTEIRTIRARLKDFFGGLFDLESGDFKDNVIPPAAWVDSPSNPSSGSDLYTQVTVDRRGFVVGGSTALTLNSPRVFRAVYDDNGGFFEKPDGVTQLSPTPVQDWGGSIPTGNFQTISQIRVYEFIVPDGVTRLSVTVFGSGGPIADGGKAWSTFQVTPGDIYRAWVGRSPAGPSAFLAANSPVQRYITSDGYVVGAIIQGRMSFTGLTTDRIYVAHAGGYISTDTVLVVDDNAGGSVLRSVPAPGFIHTLRGEIMRTKASRDVAGGTEITVERGFYGSTPADFADGDMMYADPNRFAISPLRVRPYGMAGNSVGFNFNGVGRPGAVIIEWYA